LEKRLKRLKRSGARLLARAVLSQARSDWEHDVRHHEVEAFLDGKLIELYLEIAEVDKDAYLASVRGNGGKDNQG